MILRILNRDFPTQGLLAAVFVRAMRTILCNTSKGRAIMRRSFVCSVFFLLLFCSSISTSILFAQEKSDYMGQDACKQCHQDHYDSYLKSIHAGKYVPGSPGKGDSCEACHGPGAVHVQKEGGKGTILSYSRSTNPKEKSGKCLVCHLDSNKMAFWNLSKHKTSGISCDSCHVVHVGTGSTVTSRFSNLNVQKKYLKTPLPDLCFGCHKDIRAQTLRQSHHPIQEGKTPCFSCHVAHGGFGPKMIKTDSVNELCYKCHAEKRGPYMIEHPPVAENCLNCHVAHGGNHNSLLVAKTPQLCQSCHDFAGHPGVPNTKFETFQGRNPSNRMFSRNCQLCHSAIHGSSSPADRGKKYIR
jgi:DmsE family decaheme c-type cytochrome